MNKKRNHSTFHIGDRVRFDFGGDKTTGVIVEDRGPYGAGGDRLFTVEIPQDPLDPMTWVLAENEMVAVDQGTEPVPTIAKERAIEYLKNGGLVSILRSNMAGGKCQPRVWLCLNNLGDVTHTFYEERGGIGGQIPPTGALWENRIAASKRDLVVPFVETFGLSHQEAEEVVAAVGTSRQRKSRS